HPLHHHPLSLHDALPISFNATVQKVLPHSFTVQVGYVGNRQRDIARNQNINYSPIGGGNASLPFNQLGLAGGFRTTAAVNVVKPDRKSTRLNSSHQIISY